MRNIPNIQSINFTRIPGYNPPSKDPLLLKFAKESGVKYIMSTSTISSALSQMYFLFSGFKTPDFSMLSEDYSNQPMKYMISQRKPITNIVKKIDAEKGIYAFDSDPGIFKNKETVLMALGKVMER